MSTGTAGLIILLIAGLFIGLALYPIEILNPESAAANAEKMRVETDHQRIMNQIEEQERLAKLQEQNEQQLAALERQRQQAEAAYQRQVAWSRTIQSVAPIMILAVFAVIVFALIVCIGLIAYRIIFRTIEENSWTRAETISPYIPRSAAIDIQLAELPVPTIITDPWRNDAFRKNRIAQARECERKKIEARLAKTGKKMHTIIYMSSAPRRLERRKDYRSLPVAGDD